MALRIESEGELWSLDSVETAEQKIEDAREIAMELNR